MLRSGRRRGSWGSLGTDRAGEAAGWPPASASCAGTGSNLDAAILHGPNNGILRSRTGRYSATLRRGREEGSEREKAEGRRGWNKEPICKPETAEKGRIVPDSLFLNWLTRIRCVWVRILCHLQVEPVVGWEEQCKSPFFASAQTSNQQRWSPAATRNPEHWAWNDRYRSFSWYKACQSPVMLLQLGGWTQAEGLALHYKNYCALLVLRGGKTSKEDGGLQGDVRRAKLPNVIWSRATGSPLCQNLSFNLYSFLERASVNHPPFVPRFTHIWTAEW